MKRFDDIVLDFAAPGEAMTLLLVARYAYLHPALLLLPFRRPC